MNEEIEKRGLMQEITEILCTLLNEAQNENEVREIFWIVEQKCRDILMERVKL